MPEEKTILIVGGYGAVGTHIVTELHRNLPEAQIIVAGRSLKKAKALADTFASGVTAQHIDLTSRASINAVFPMASLVVLNTEAGAETAARACIDHRISMISVAASVSVMRTIGSISADAKAAHVALVTEVGLAPGLSNLMLQHIVDDVPQTEVAELILQLGLVGTHGVEAMDWTLARCVEASRAESIVPPLPAVGRYVIPVDFVDRDKVKQKLQVETVTSALALVPKWSTRMLPAIAPLLVRYPGILSVSQPFLRAILQALRLSDDTLGLFVRARSDHASGTIQLAGQNQSRVTGMVAAKVAEKLLTAEAAQRTGHVGISDIVSLEELLPSLEKIGCSLVNERSSI